MKDILQFLSNNLAVILSSLISIFTVIGTIINAMYQTNKQSKSKAMELYFQAQLNAYTELYHKSIEIDHQLNEGEERDLRPFAAACKNAELLSPSHVAEQIINFEATCFTLVKEIDENNVSEKTEQQFSLQLEIVGCLLRNELMRYDKNRPKSDKKIKNLIKLSKVQYKK